MSLQLLQVRSACEDFMHIFQESNQTQMWHNQICLSYTSCLPASDTYVVSTLLSKDSSQP